MSERRPVHVRRIGNHIQLTADATATAREVATAMRECVPPDARVEGPLRARFTAVGDGREGADPVGQVTP